VGHHTYLPTSVRGVWLYLYLMIDVWSLFRTVKYRPDYPKRPFANKD
jgi:hypothetical protein